MEPISIPSSSEAVATTHRSSPEASRRSTSRRCSLETDPWCAWAMTGAPCGIGSVCAAVPISQDSR